MHAGIPFPFSSQAVHCSAMRCHLKSSFPNTCNPPVSKGDIVCIKMIKTENAPDT